MNNYDDPIDLFLNTTNPCENWTIEDAGQWLSEAEANGWKFPDYVTPQFILDLYNDMEPEEEEEDEPMNNEPETNEYDILVTIFRFIRDYHTRTHTLPDVCRRLLEHLETAGYQVQATDMSHRDYKVIHVDGHCFKILRQKDWSTYDVIMTA